MGETVPPRERVRYQGYLAAIFMVSSTFGPVAGGWLTQHFGWASVFWINLPLGAVAAVLALRLPARTLAPARVRFDWLGLGLFTGFVVPLLLALEQVQRISAAAVPGILALVGVAALSLVLLLRQERRIGGAADPRQPAAPARDLAGRCDGRRRGRHDRGRGDVHADLLAGGARRRARAGGAAAAAADGGHRHRRVADGPG